MQFWETDLNKILSSDRTFHIRRGKEKFQSQLSFNQLMCHDSNWLKLVTVYLLTKGTSRTDPVQPEKCFVPVVFCVIIFKVAGGETESLQ